MPDRRHARRKRVRNRSAQTPCGFIRLKNPGSLSRPSRTERTMLITLPARSGKWVASHSRNSGATSWGRRSMIQLAEPTPTAPARSRIDSINSSVIAGITGAIETCAGTPAATSRPSAASRLAGAEARGSSRPDSRGSRLVTDIPTATSRCCAISASRSRSSSTRADLVVIVTGCRASRHTSSTARVIR